MALNNKREHAKNIDFECVIGQEVMHKFSFHIHYSLSIIFWNLKYLFYLCGEFQKFTILNTNHYGRRAEL